eukprot:gnl/Carplike_NY0171/2326_a3133_461.p1 GENE.gnl/Carplike_NY0171/2326_a3133_461~~gnl/Carplike_NY0171/2326_a3133_461.p1  ORF type:complete len:1186 (-),score=357.54 gnl/Carplike_NY0171/2326_a3133_461:181-3237(-)
MPEVITPSSPSNAPIFDTRIWNQIVSIAASGIEYGEDILRMLCEYPVEMYKWVCDCADIVDRDKGLPECIVKMEKETRGDWKQRRVDAKKKKLQHDSSLHSHGSKDAEEEGDGNEEEGEKKKEEGEQQEQSDINPLSDKTPISEFFPLFARLLVVKYLRFGELINSITAYTSFELGSEFVTPPPLSLPLVFQETSNTTPLVFILSQGADPLSQLQTYAKECGMEERLSTISLGQGQGPKAKKMIRDATNDGGWVFLANAHLSALWVHELERIVGGINKSGENAAREQKGGNGKKPKGFSPTTGVLQGCRLPPNPSFRLLISSMPTDIFPVSVLQNSVKVTTEPPKGLKANLVRTLSEMKEIEFEEAAIESDDKRFAFKRLLFGLVFFHGIVQERRKFGANGWNKSYEFNDSDFDVSRKMLKNFLVEQPGIPWPALQYLISEVNYGGRVTDDWDRRLIKTILNTFYVPDILEEVYQFSPSGVYHAAIEREGKASTLDGVREYVSSLPRNEDPEIFGMHANAAYSFLTQETDRLIDCLLAAQPESVQKDEYLVQFDHFFSVNRDKLLRGLIEMDIGGGTKNSNSEKLGAAGTGAGEDKGPEKEQEQEGGSGKQEEGKESAQISTKEQPQPQGNVEDGRKKSAGKTTGSGKYGRQEEEDGDETSKTPSVPESTRALKEFEHSLFYEGSDTVDKAANVKNRSNMILENLPKSLISGRQRQGIDEEGGSGASNPSDGDEVEVSELTFVKGPTGLLHSLSVVLVQEIDRFNSLLDLVKRSLVQVCQAIDGLAVMSASLENVYNAVYTNRVPKLWSDAAYPSLMPLSSWVENLRERVETLRSWIRRGPPVSFWLSGFFFPQGFITGVLQQHSRKHQKPIDILRFRFTVKDILFIEPTLPEEEKKRIEGVRYVEDLTEEDRVEDGVLVHGLYLDSGYWNPETLKLEPAREGELFSALPVMHLLPVPNFQRNPRDYAAPLYKTATRAGALSTTGQSSNFILAVDLPTDRHPNFFILQSTALLCALKE